MGLVIGGSVAFSIGGAFMPATNGFRVLSPSLVVALSFLIGAAMLARAVAASNLSTTMTLGLGIEALLTVGVGRFLLGDRITVVQALGMLLIVEGVVLVRVGSGPFPRSTDHHVAMNLTTYETSMQTQVSASGARK